jgi:GNAT superfamily N-acetyltransferase
MSDLASLADDIGTHPYVPTLGPIHPEENAASLWLDVLSVNGTGEFLPYDKERVWSDKKTSRILTEAITDTDTYLLVPVLDTRGHGRVDLHVYGDIDAGPTVAAEAAAKLAADHGTQTARVCWFRHEPDDRASHTVRIQLKEFDWDATEPDIAWPVEPLTEQPPGVRANFADFAVAAGEGFPFLAARQRDGIDDGPILTIRQLARLVGAIGPMRAQADSRGHERLLGQYFAVLPEHRGQGYGRDLWRAAMWWGQQNRADYQLLQTEIESPSDQLCRSEGLTSVGFIHTLRVSR